MWRCPADTNNTVIPGPPTIPDHSPLRTMWFWETVNGKLTKMVGSAADRASFGRHPWRAPGTAPTYRPCGYDGGNPLGCPPGNPNVDNCDGGGYGHGFDVRTLPVTEKSYTTWPLGSQQEVSWGFLANRKSG